METPKFLMREESKPELLAESELQQLEDLVKALQGANDEIAKLEAQLSEVKGRQKSLSEEAIPTLLNQHGFSELKLKNGVKVVVTEEASVSVPDDKKEAFFAFLKERNEEDIIKLLVQFAKMPIEKQQELFDFLNGYGYDYDAEKGVHPQTLKAYVKKLLGVGEEPLVVEQGVAAGKYLRKQDVAHVMNVYTFFKTKLKA